MTSTYFRWGRDLNDLRGEVNIWGKSDEAYKKVKTQIREGQKVEKEQWCHIWTAPCHECIQKMALYYFVVHCGRLGEHKCVIFEKTVLILLLLWLMNFMQFTVLKLRCLYLYKYDIVLKIIFVPTTVHCLICVSRNFSKHSFL